MSNSISNLPHASELALQQKEELKLAYTLLTKVFVKLQSQPHLTDGIFNSFLTSRVNLKLFLKAILEEEEAEHLEVEAMAKALSGKSISEFVKSSNLSK